MSSRRKFTPILKLWLPRATDRSSTNCHCVDPASLRVGKPCAKPPDPGTVAQSSQRAVNRERDVAREQVQRGAGRTKLPKTTRVVQHRTR